MTADILYEALAVLRAVKEIDVKDFPQQSIPWIRVQRAHSALEMALILAGLQVPVEKPAEVTA